MRCSRGSRSTARRRHHTRRKARRRRQPNPNRDPNPSSNPDPDPTLTRSLAPILTLPLTLTRSTVAAGAAGPLTGGPRGVRGDGGRGCGLLRVLPSRLRRDRRGPRRLAIEVTPNSQPPTQMPQALSPKPRTPDRDPSPPHSPPLTLTAPSCATHSSGSPCTPPPPGRGEAPRTPSAW